MKILKKKSTLTGKARRSTLIYRFNLLKSLGYKITKMTTILDFGCGNGLEVQKLKMEGYNVYGCDIKIDAQNHESNTLLNEGILKLIDPTEYKLPFEDNTFDLIYSYQVLEHVKNHQVIFREMCRVLKSTGITYNHFPSKFRFIESHIKVPFASAISNLWWLYLWAFLGVRNKYQKNLSVKETVKWNKEYLKEHTNYLSNRSYKSLFNMHFKTIKHCEKAFLSEIFKKKKLLEFVINNNLIAFIFRFFHSVIIVTERPKK